VAIASALVVVAGLVAAVEISLRLASSANSLDDGRAAYRRSDFLAASRLARSWLQVKHNDSDALRLLARSSLRLGDEARALSIYKGLGDEALRGEDFYLLGLNQQRRGDLTGAVTSWQLGVQQDPGHVEMLEILARSLGELDRFIPAVLVVRQLMSQPKSGATANLILGELYDLMNAPEQAALALERGLNEAGSQLDAAEATRKRKLLARCLLRIQRPADARQILQQISGSDGPGEPETAWLWARCDLQEGRSTSAPIQKRAQLYRDESPLTSEPAAYVGAVKCAKCHRANFDHLIHSRHGRTFSSTRQIATLPILPKSPVQDPGNSQVVHTYRTVDDHLDVATQIDDHIVHTIVDYAFGSGDRGLTLVGHNEKSHLFESRLSYYSSYGGWDVTSGQAAHPDELASYQGSILTLDIVRRCLLCHQTNPMSVLTHSGPEAADSAIGCEKCHGPGGNHLRVVESTPPPHDLAIARPSLARGEAVVQLCGECHDPRKTETRLSPTHETAIRFQASSLTWSRCYIESEKRLDCVTCHNPHRDAQTDPRSYEQKCLDCHSTEGLSGRRTSNRERAPGATSAHGSICPVQPTSGCIACHMPKQGSSIPHSRFTDHFIRVRRDSSSSDAQVDPPTR
jgi:tetratricopeptide (TPR) repeat protein